MKFVMIGNLTIDEILMPDGRHLTEQCGGNCLYAAVGARLWSDQVGIVSLAGSDFPREWLAQVAEAGIDTGGIALRPDPHGMRAGLAYDPGGERTFIDDGQGGRGEYERTPDEWAGWLEHSPTPQLWPSVYEDALGVHLAPIPLPAIRGWVRTLRKPGRILTLDSPWWDGAAGSLEPDRATLGALDALLPSEAETRVFYEGALAPEAAALTLGRLREGAVVVKIGARGALVYDPRRDEALHVPAYPATVVDPTGAGDAFCGGFLVGLAETGDVVEAVRYGTVSASFVVEGFSSLYALSVSRADAEARLRALGRESA